MNNFTNGPGYFLAQMASLPSRTLFSLVSVLQLEYEIHRRESSPKHASIDFIPFGNSFAQ